MKKFLMTAVLGMFALAGFSQVKWDARVGMNFSNMTKDSEAKALPGFNLGVGMDYGFSENWSLQSGLMISSKGWKYKEEGEKMTFRPIYLDIPILAAYKFNISDNTKFVINAGPYLAFGLGGKAKYGDVDYKLFKSDEGDWKRFDLGIQYGIGLELSDHYLINLTGQNGFICPWDTEEGEDKCKNMTFSIGVGYRF
ncbi:PorT family protein [Phocaeicola plebeius]|jgi:opacity protein-like surface antigen|uniref:PorT family protein n=1 Tax=Phocaeicola plebeius TaxID=310297 RepID=A0A415J661_9BACT|nr:porin family protein [Phocaeicola plebeius]RHK96017.1 PorT family protein [Phocaeicola plebeius]RHL15714.1 PorT family protein [Phocaeicola plebeius]